MRAIRIFGTCDNGARFFSPASYGATFEILVAAKVGRALQRTVMIQSDKLSDLVEHSSKYTPAHGQYHRSKNSKDSENLVTGLHDSDIDITMRRH